MIYTFEFDNNEMGLILNSLVQKPYGEVFQFVNKLQTEIANNGENKAAIILELSEEELNTTINAVAMRPYVEVFKFIAKIQEEVHKQGNEPAVPVVEDDVEI